MVKMIVKSNREIGDKAARPEIPNALQVMKMSYSKISGYGSFIVKMKGAMEGIGIGKDT